MDLRIVKDAAGLAEAVRRLEQRPILACDLETTGLDPWRDETLLIQLGDDRFQVAVDARQVQDLSPLQAVLGRKGLTVFHNAQFDLKFLKRLGLEVSRPQDTMLLEVLLAGGRKVGARTLKASCERRVGVSLDKAERATFVGFSGTLTDSQIRYALDDVIATWHLFVAQAPRIEREGLARVAQIEGAAVDAFAELELRGIHLDRAAWEAALAQAEAARDEARRGLERALKPVVGADLFGNVQVNFESEAEMRDVFARLGYADLPDLSKRTLSRLDHPVAKGLLAWRAQQSVLATHGEGFLEHLHPVTGRIHPRFKQIGASTGRTACEGPNLQNIRGTEGFRSAFRAPEGRRMITADYAACELRILAEMSGDTAFRAAFAEGEDVHSAVASRIFGRPVSKTDHPELRARAKAVSFGLIYGMGPSALAEQLAIPVPEAERLQDQYFESYPRIRKHLNDSARDALERGWAETLSGRRLYFERLDEPERRGQLERLARNMPIQGTSADITKLALARAGRAFRREGLDAFPVNTIHDEVVIEVAADHAEAAAEVLRREMVEAGAAFLRSVPMEVDVAVGDHWSKA